MNSVERAIERNPYALYKSHKENIELVLSKIYKTGDFTLSSGKKSDFYIDCKEVILGNYGLTETLYVINLLKFSSNCIAGVTSGADPLVCGYITKYSASYGLFIRNEKKSYGTKKLIEGKFNEGDSVVIVDDVLTTGGSIKYAFDILVKHNLKPIQIIVVVDRQENKAAEEIKSYTGLNVYAITNKESLIKIKW